MEKGKITDKEKANYRSIEFEVETLQNKIIG